MGEEDEHVFHETNADSEMMIMMIVILLTTTTTGAMMAVIRMRMTC